MGFTALLTAAVLMGRGVRTDGTTAQNCRQGMRESWHVFFSSSINLSFLSQGVCTPWLLGSRWQGRLILGGLGAPSMTEAILLYLVRTAVFPVMAPFCFKCLFGKEERRRGFILGPLGLPSPGPSLASAFQPQ